MKQPHQDEYANLDTTLLYERVGEEKQTCKKKERKKQKEEQDDEDNVTTEKQSGNEEENITEETKEMQTKTQKALVLEIKEQTKGAIKESKQSKENQQRKQDTAQEERRNEEEVCLEHLVLLQSKHC